MVIGLTGKKQAGKNTVASMLAVYSPLPVVEVSYAAKLKQSVAALLACSVEDLERWKNDPEAWVHVSVGGNDLTWQTVREFLQRYGTEAHRKIFGEDFWLDAALPPDGHYLGRLFVVTDVRFPNEAERIKALGGMIVRVVGPPEVEEAGDGHASETPLPDEFVDVVLPNDRRNDGFAYLDKAVRELVLTMPMSAVTA